MRCEGRQQKAGRQEQIPERRRNSGPIVGSNRLRCRAGPETAPQRGGDQQESRSGEELVDQRELRCRIGASNGSGAGREAEQGGAGGAEGAEPRGRQEGHHHGQDVVDRRQPLGKSVQAG